ncbi:HDL240Cp [Eremothecium sinecaudum]|uniref:ferroxidase n=1 Tax=Eremothecium sinecaudum TaxID=45286 RepID=A0A0X8HS74_9SACH|nr:HDL240Cp [Eremothecium sinecaudum]AMD20504.1 HDL240Cp [Eremothecium sinecaudum]
MLKNTCYRAIASRNLHRSICTIPRLSFVAVRLVPNQRSNARTSIVQRLHYSQTSTNKPIDPNELNKMPSHLYEEKAEEFLNSLLDKLEELAEQHPEAVSDVEYSQGVLTIVAPNVGTYVVNKQPPNKQIWLSSPISGPNRYNYYEDEWLSLRDSTNLRSILAEELSKSIKGHKIVL